MKMQPVTSSQIAAIGQEGNVLHVRFKNGVTYEYENVTPELFQTLLDAPSVGSTFHSLIKTKPAEFPFKKLG